MRYQLHMLNEDGSVFSGLPSAEMTEACTRAEAYNAVVLGFEGRETWAVDIDSGKVLFAIAANGDRYTARGILEEIRDTGVSPFKALGGPVNLTKEQRAKAKKERPTQRG